MKYLYVVLIVFFYCCHNGQKKETQANVTNNEIDNTSNSNVSKISLDPNSTLVVSAQYLYGVKDCHGQSTNQELFFLQSNDTVKRLDVNHIALLQTKPIMLCNYRLYRIGVDSINYQKFYVLYFYLANGEPEIYLFYDRRGMLLFSQICSRVECESVIFDFNKEDALEYLNSEFEINFVNVQ
jgi:hypothetical protein